MKDRRKLLILAASVTIVALAVLFTIGKATRQGEDTSDPALREAPTPIEVVPAEVADMEVKISSRGDIEAEAEVQVLSKVRGRLEALQIDEGDAVTAGQVIAVIEHEDLQVEVERAQAELDSVRAEWALMQAGTRIQELEQAEDRVRRAKADLDDATITLKRVERLLAGGFVSKEELDRAQVAHTAAETELAIAKKHLGILEEGARKEERQALLARVRKAEANLERARIDLANATITAPITGLVSKRYVDEGEFITLSTPMFRLVAMDTVKLMVDVVERDIPSIEIGATTWLWLDAYPGETFTGKVAKISPVVDPDTRTAEVEIRVANPDYRLKPGMYARVEIVIDWRENALLVPKDALLPGQNSPTIYVHKDGRAHLRSIDTGLEERGLVEVLSNLEPGEEVVVAGQTKLRDNAPVRVVPRRGGN